MHCSIYSRVFIRNSTIAPSIESQRIPQGPQVLERRVSEQATGRTSLNCWVGGSLVSGCVQMSLLSGESFALVLPVMRKTH